MKNLFAVIATIVLVGCFAAAQNPPAQTPPAANPNDFSGMYSFLQEGEFVQINVEDQGIVTGFVSRYGDLDSDRGAFLDQFFKNGKTDGKKLDFTTDQVHGTWFEFHGVVSRGPGKTPNDEAYYVINGKLTKYVTDATKKTTAQQRDVTFKSFPQDVSLDQPKRD
jgi:hypothetical protein